MGCRGDEILAVEFAETVQRQRAPGHQAGVPHDVERAGVFGFVFAPQGALGEGFRFGLRLDLLVDERYFFPLPVSAVLAEGIGVHFP